ncbi:metal-dependent hydrolase [Pseudonocardia abyssalis]|uniref:Metal-dependent hydrolase n=1 Tax=Pseudonocardia abyssalis TaxID=2792008 RepID=A0ABS6UW85_9PSEU|nr:metal-dependent hydrolase [Pseudonocardia abyssalis]MBW0115977.1 metal-dependent hydrolase [Pseudonocardia abyssalis]MBW0136540.1 metal-dependent hydrolase [Pseudonocardia abyssalis]
MTRVDDPADLVLVARDVHFDWSDLPLHWIPGEPVGTHVLNVLHLLLPAGERFFVDLFTQALPRIADEDLADQVRGFIGQEAMHARAHDEVLDVLHAAGIDTRPYTEQVEWIFGWLLGGRWAGHGLVERLAVVAAIEHLTSVLGDWVLGASALDHADPVMLDLLRWHGAEEVEHRCVAFDTLVHLDDSYLRRARAMLLVAPVLTWLWARGALFLTEADPTCPRRARWSDWVRLGRRGVVPDPFGMAWQVARWFRPGYHPSQDGSTARAVAYLGTSPAANR